MNYLLNFTSVNAVASGNSSEVAGKSIIEASRKSNGDKPRENRGFGRHESIVVRSSWPNRVYRGALYKVRVAAIF
jgi:hypothetical protein